MIYLILLLSFELKSLDNKDIKKYSPEQKRDISVELIKEKEYNLALSFAPDKNLTGCIKILKGDLSDGIEDIKESAAKGNIFSCNVYILFNLQTGEKDLKNYIKNGLKLSSDTTFSYESPFARYLASHPESLYIQNIPSDSLLYPYILFKSGMINIEQKPEKAEKYFKILLENYPNSLPAIIARNTIRALKKKR